MTQIYQLTIILICIVLPLRVNCIYTVHHRRCILQSANSTYLNSLEYERIPRIPNQYKYQPKHHYRKPLSYLKDYSMVYYQYKASGASGEVYLVELQNRESKEKGSHPKILKRFFQNHIDQFQEENYIMSKLEYSVEWIREEGTKRQPQTDSDYEIQQKDLHSTIAVYPYSPSTTMTDAQVSKYNLPILIYKFCKQLEKGHKHGIIHNDLKLANALIIPKNEGVNDLFDVKLIDWNLASFYYHGYYSSMKKGTLCYYSPQALFRTNFLTPMTDVYSLAVAIFYYITNKKPYGIKCNKQFANNLESVISKSGYIEMLEVVCKYRYNMDDMMREALNVARREPEFRKPSNLREIIPQQYTKYFNDELIDLLEKMLEEDPEKRLTMKQVLQDPYFYRITQLPPMFAEKNKEQAFVPKPSHTYITKSQTKLQHQYHTIPSKSPQNPANPPNNVINNIPNTIPPNAPSNPTNPIITPNQSPKNQANNPNVPQPIVNAIKS